MQKEARWRTGNSAGSAVTMLFMLRRQGCYARVRLLRTDTSYILNLQFTDFLHSFPTLNPARQDLDAAAAYGVDEVGGDLSQGDKDKGSLRQTRMGDDQLRCLDDQIAIKKYVDIDGAGSIGEAGHSIQGDLDPLNQGKKLEGTDISGSTANGVEEQGLLLVAHGLGLVDRGDLL